MFRKGGFFINFKFIFIYLAILIFISIYYYSFFQFYYSNTTINSNNNSNNTNFSNNNYIFSSNNFFWPIPGFHTITSPFGKRKSPTTGASSNHSGIDIAAPENTIIYSIIPGKITYTGFFGADGYTVIEESNEFTILYCHVSPNFLVSVGNFINIGEPIANVGPKYITAIPNNKYTDSTGKQTNGAITGCHLHLTIKKDNIPINPLELF